MVMMIRKRRRRIDESGFFLMVCSWVDSLIIIIKVSIRSTTNMYPESTISYTRRGAAGRSTSNLLLGRFPRCLGVSRSKI